MAELGHITDKNRSKNAGPFWLTIDIFCGSPETFAKVRDSLSTARVSQVFNVDETALKRFDIAALIVMKFSQPRPPIQGSIQDRNMHGASWAVLMAEVELN